MVSGQSVSALCGTEMGRTNLAMWNGSFCLAEVEDPRKLIRILFLECSDEDYLTSFERGKLKSYLYFGIFQLILKVALLAQGSIDQGLIHCTLTKSSYSSFLYQAKQLFLNKCDLIFG